MTTSSIAFTYDCIECKKEVSVRREDTENTLVRRSCCSNSCLSKYLDSHSGEEPAPPQGLRKLWLESKEGPILETLAELKDEWAKNPQLRLGQLVVNTMSAGGSESLMSDLFTIENEDFIKILKRFSAQFGAASSD